MSQDKTLEALEAQLRLIADTVPALISYVDKGGRYQFNNRAYEKWFGKTREEIAGKHMREVLGVGAWGKVRPYFKRVMAGEEVTYEDLLPYKAGGPRWVSVTYTPHVSARGEVEGMIVLVSDVTQRKEFEEAFKRESQFNATLLATTAALILVLDRNAGVVHVNRAFEMATGYEIGEIKGKSFFSMFLFPEEDSPVGGVFERLLKKKAQNHYINYIRKRDGGRVLIEWSNNVILDESGKVLFVVGTGVDITERRSLEKEILVVTDRERQRIGCDLHDGLGQELTALQFSMHTLQSEIREQAPKLEPVVAELSRRLRGAVRHSRIISHGLAPVGVDAEGLPVALRRLVKSASLLQKTRVEFQTEGSFVLQNPAISNQLFRIAQEALNNAVKHSQARKVRLLLEEKPGQWKLTVSDDGVGFRLDAHEESGLGLNILRYRAELIRAHLKIRSKPGKGTRVVCSVPKSAVEIKL
ncbi:MAG: PAS domain-containing sensor histidine kinase [Limisphaerales bacterium]